MCEGENKIDNGHKDCCGNGSCSDGVNITTKAKLLELAQKSGSTPKNRGCKFHPAFGI